MNDSAKTIRAAKARLEKFDSTVTGIEAERERLLANHDGSLDTKTCEKLAMLTAAQLLAQHSRTRIVSELAAVTEVGLREQQAIAGNIRRGHSAIDAGISSRVLATAPDDLRDSINVKTTKSFQAEVAARVIPQVSMVYINERMKDGDLKAGAALVASGLDTLSDELIRVTKVAKAYSVSF